MHIIVDNIEIDIGSSIDYPQMNPVTGAYSDKVKYRLTQQNDKILVAIQAIASLLDRITEEIKLLQAEYIWVADDDTIMASDDNTILMFCSDLQSMLADIQRRQDLTEQNISQLAGEPVITYSDPT